MKAKSVGIYFTIKVAVGIYLIFFGIANMECVGVLVCGGGGGGGMDQHTKSGGGKKKHNQVTNETDYLAKFFIISLRKFREFRTVLPPKVIRKFGFCLLNSATLVASS